MGNWRDGLRGAFAMGMRHGTFCLGCCWALMGVLFVVGVMNLVWVGVLTVFVLIEKIGPTGVRLARTGGAHHDRARRDHGFDRLLSGRQAPRRTAIPASKAYVEPESGERHLRSIRQLTFGGNNAEAYFSPDGKRLIFQRQDSVSSGCDQQYVMSTKTFSNQRGLRASQPLDASFPVPPSCPGAAVRGRLRRVFGSP